MASTIWGAPHFFIGAMICSVALFLFLQQCLVMLPVYFDT
jgi:hypothetical protein